MASTVSRNLRELRQTRGMTQEQLAEAAGSTDATISRIERGRFAPSQALLVKLAAALDVDPAELVRAASAPKKTTMRPAEARLLAAVRGLDDAAVDDVTRAIKLIIAAAHAPRRRPR